MRVLKLNSSCSIIKGMIDAKMLPADIEYPIELISSPDKLTVQGVNAKDTYYFPLGGSSVIV